MQIFIFSEKYIDVLTKYLTDAKKCSTWNIFYLVADDNISTASKLVAALSEITGKDAYAIQPGLLDFLAENDHIHIDAFINICMEEIA